jgi:hypothetical protein
MAYIRRIHPMVGGTAGFRAELSDPARGRRPTSVKSTMDAAGRRVA